MRATFTLFYNIEKAKEKCAYTCTNRQTSEDDGWQVFHTWLGYAKYCYTGRLLKNRCRHILSVVAILPKTVAELFDSMTAGFVLRTFMQYSRTSCAYWKVGTRLTSLHRLSNSLTYNDLDSIGYLFRLLFVLQAYCVTLRYLYVRRLIKHYYCYY